MKIPSKIGIIILAAGASVRMGKPKQLLEYNGKTLLLHTIQEAVDSVCFPIVTVLGSTADILKVEIKNSDVKMAENIEWKNGMSSSIKVGLQKLLDSDDQINGVLIMVCDQPLVSVEIINQIVETHQKSDSLIVASRYRDTLGVPALFSRRLFSELLNMENVGGAKNLIEKFKDQTSAVNFPDGEFDIDTPEDYRKLSEIKNGFK